MSISISASLIDLRDVSFALPLQNAFEALFTDVLRPRDFSSRLTADCFCWTPYAELP